MVSCLCEGTTPGSTQYNPGEVTKKKAHTRTRSVRTPGGRKVVGGEVFPPGRVVANHQTSLRTTKTLQASMQVPMSARRLSFPLSKCRRPQRVKIGCSGKPRAVPVACPRPTPHGHKGLA